MIRDCLAPVHLAVSLVVQLLRRPELVPTALRQARSLVPRRWWASTPRLPIPRREYLEFRQVTLSGTAAGLPEAGDVIVWLEWCRSIRSLRRSP